MTRTDVLTVTVLIPLRVSRLSVCKFLTLELQEALEKTGRSKEVLEVGEVLDTGKRRRKIKYNTSYVNCGECRVSMERISKLNCVCVC